MVPFLPLHPGVLAIAQEIQRRANEDPTRSILDHLSDIVTERPPLNILDYTKLAAQVNDLMDIAQPSGDRLRLALMVFLPHRRGTLFTASEMRLIEAITVQFPPLSGMAGRLGTSLDASWPKIVEILQSLPLPPPALVLPSGANPLPPETHHPAAAGPIPVNIQQFMKPDQG